MSAGALLALGILAGLALLVVVAARYGRARGDAARALERAREAARVAAAVEAADESVSVAARAELIERMRRYADGD